MKDLVHKMRVAVVQAAPILFNKKATTKKVVNIVREAGRQGAQLIVFPESFIPCYPLGLTFGFTVGQRDEAQRDDWKVYYDNSVVVPGEETQMIAKAAAEAKAYVSIGMTERDETHCSLYCTNLIFSPEGELVYHHRKIKPTGAERYIWADNQDKDKHFPVLPCYRYTIRQNGKPDLLGKLHAAGKSSSLQEGGRYVSGTKYKQ